MDSDKLCVGNPRATTKKWRELKCYTKIYPINIKEGNRGQMKKMTWDKIYVKMTDIKLTLWIEKNDS